MNLINLIRIAIVFLCFIFYGNCVIAQEFKWLYPPENDQFYQLPESVKSDDIERITKVFHPRMQIFTPSPENDNGDFIIVCPGGGYHILAIDLEGTEIAEWLTSVGYTAIVLEYTVPENRDRALEEVMEMITQVRRRDDYQENSKLGIIGFSAGGHLAARAATYQLGNKNRGDNLVLDFAALIYPAYLDKGENETLSPEIVLNSETVPMFIFVAADDFHAASSIVLSGALQKNKTSVEFHLLPEGGHGFGLRSGNEAAETWPGLLNKWLKKR